MLLMVLLPFVAGVARSGTSSRVAEVHFAGNRALDDRDLLRWMALQRPGFATHSDFSPAEFLADLQRLRRLYHGEGYLAATVEGAAEAPETGDGVALEIRIGEGPRWVLTGCELQLEGPEATPELGDSLFRRLELVGPGAYRLRVLAADRGRLESLLRSQGFLDARVQPLAARDDSGHCARLCWRIDTGPRARLAGARIYGLERVRESAVRREIATRPGRVLRVSSLELTRQNLVRSGLFEEVEVVPAPRDSGQVDKHLVIVVRERAGGSVGTGFGYGTSDRARILSSFEHRNLDGRGLRFAVRGVYGERRRGGEAELVVPWVLGRRVTLALGGAHERLSPRAWTVERTRGSLHLVRQLSSQVRADLGYRLERQQLLDVRTRQGTPGRTRVGLVSLGVVRETRDDLRRPRQGSYLCLQQDWSTPRLGSLHRFARTELERIGHRPWGPLTLSTRARLGWIAPQASGSSAPLNERYFAGGQHTIRGFPEDAVGPTGEDGLPSGGRYLVLATLETRIDLIWRLGATAFVDAGDVVHQANGLAWRRLSVGAGSGLIMDSAIGRVRASVAFPLTSRFRDGAQTYFSTGAAF